MDTLIGEIHELVGRYAIDVVFHSDDVSTSAYAPLALADRLPVRCMKLPKLATFDLLNDKWNFTQFCERHGIRAPQGWLFDSAAALRRALDNGAVVLPITAKPINRSGGVGVFHLRQPDDIGLIDAIDYQPVLAQHHVVGESVSITAMCDRGRVVAHVAQQRDCARFRVFANADLLDNVRRLAALTDYSGPANFDAIIADHDEPRLSRRMQSALLVLDLLGDDCRGSISSILALSGSGAPATLGSREIRLPWRRNRRAAVERHVKARLEVPVLQFARSVCLSAASRTFPRRQRGGGAGRPDGSLPAEQLIRAADGARPPLVPWPPMSCHERHHGNSFVACRAGRAWVAAAGVARLEASPVPGCILMKPGKDGPPVFLIPGATGSVLQLAPFASALRRPRRCRSTRSNRAAWSRRRDSLRRHLSEMARHAIAVMTAVQAQGPYLLVGYSAGGLQWLWRLARQSSPPAAAKVKLLVLLDTYPGRRFWPLRCHVEILVRQALRASWLLSRCAPRQAASEVTRRIRSLFWWYLAASGVKLVDPPPLTIEGTDAASRRVHEATYNAGEAYRPSRYAGKVVFVQPEGVANLEPRQPRRVWGRFLDDMTIRRVPGSHFGMLEEGAEAAGQEISRCLADAIASAP